MNMIDMAASFERITEISSMLFYDYVDWFPTDFYCQLCWSYIDCMQSVASTLAFMPNLSPQPAHLSLLSVSCYLASAAFSDPSYTTFWSPVVRYLRSFSLGSPLRFVRAFVVDNALQVAVPLEPMRWRFWVSL
ncbi:hypothetical protein VTP01DRAFT_10636 [Rhizomucor pusillus]|uniref:uncharacterized protein n=1 Tax=Rhizomucor pusillus TaxID=4840 RepID=UPI0037441F1F